MGSATSISRCLAMRVSIAQGLPTVRSFNGSLALELVAAVWFASVLVAFCTYRNNRSCAAHVFRAPTNSVFDVGRSLRKTRDRIIVVAGLAFPPCQWRRTKRSSVERATPICAALGRSRSGAEKSQPCSSWCYHRRQQCPPQTRCLRTATALSFCIHYIAGSACDRMLVATCARTYRSIIRNKRRNLIVLGSYGAHWPSGRSPSQHKCFAVACLHSQKSSATRTTGSSRARVARGRNDGAKCPR